MKMPIKGLSLIAIAGILFLASCDNDNNPSSESSPFDTTPMSKGGGDPPNSSPSTTKEDSVTVNPIGDTNPNQATVDYLATSNKKEMAFLMAAQKTATDKELKAHSQMMLADHKKLGDQVKSLIATKNLTEVPFDTMGVVNITSPKGKEWDKAFVDKMVQDHEELLRKLKDAEREVMDSSLKTLVVKAQPIVQGHLDMSRKMQAKMK